MQIRLHVLFFMLMLTGALTSLAQKADIGILLGGSYYYGDIINKNYIETQSIHQAGGLFLRKHMSKKVCLRFNLMYAYLEASDAKLPDDGTNDFQRLRNLSFFTDIYELSGVVEYNLLQDHNKGRRIKNHLIPYIYGGLGVFYYEPKATHPVTGQTINLRPLQTEGVSYSSFALAVPLGAGVRYYLDKNWQIGFDLGMRLTSTSHIDDINGISFYRNAAVLQSEDARLMADRSEGSVFQPGDKRGKIGFITDIYFIGGVTLSYRLWPGGAGGGYRGAAVTCPRFY